MSLANPYPEPYVSAHKRAQIVVALFLAGITLDLIVIFSDFIKVVMLSNMSGDSTLTENQVFGIEVQEAITGILKLVVYILSAIFFLMWLHRAYKNLRALGAPRTEHTPGFAVGSFFIPIISLFIPYRVVKEAWIKSEPQAGEPGTVYGNSSGGTSLIGWWWGVWLVANFLGQVSLRASEPGVSYDAQFFNLKLELAANAFSLAAAVLAILVVKGIDARQTVRSRLYNSSELPPPPPIFNSQPAQTNER